jgi:hypothetical protein
MNDPDREPVHLEAARILRSAIADGERPKVQPREEGPARS